MITLLFPYDMICRYSLQKKQLENSLVRIRSHQITKGEHKKGITKQPGIN